MSSDFGDRKSHSSDLQRQFHRQLHKNSRRMQRGGNSAHANAQGTAGRGGVYFDGSSSEALEEVRSFCFYFKQAIFGSNVAEANNLYETGFTKLTEKYFQSSAWPAPEQISGTVGHNPVFVTLYKELYFRHIYAKMQPTLEQREASWKNYCELFNYFLDHEGEVLLNLPSQWLWDMVDEFIYQFQAFCQYRSKVKSKSPEEIEWLKECEEVWNPSTVIFYLESLVSKGEIHAELEKQKHSPVINLDGSNGQTSVVKMLAYFSVIGLVRIHCLFGDYYLALKTMAPIDLNKKGLFSRVTACHITTYYYYGFANLMLRRYVEAIKSFNNILLYISRTKAHHPRSYQYDQIIKKNEQMYALLAMALSLWPQKIDDSVMQGIRERLIEKLQRLQKGDEEVYTELFGFACPKFISPSPPNYDEESSITASQEPYRLQLNIFLSEVKQQASLTAIRSILKLYTSIGLDKLAGFLETTPEELRTWLLCYKHKARTLSIATGGKSKWVTASDIDFFIDEDMIHVADTRVAKKYSDYFLRHITKFEEILADFEQQK
eukprot:TRINITY_DN18775_c0_g1_i1.p1 TRINITY_DN18775_c0_g1~~TRINITY_DN18775_c0_g1_i1.p1  ORF type:complete len:547 (+),score=121.38 TRINITY_DN18775_c0_g1_i1:44-1684(+)